jgi:hypothetical protein
MDYKQYELHKIPDIIENLSILGRGEMLIEQCLQEICEILTKMLRSFGCVENVHNYAQIVNLISYKLFTIDILNISQEDFSDNDFPHFTESNEAEELEYAVFRACGVLLLRIKKRYMGSEIAKSATEVDDYMEKMGYYPEYYIE